MKFGGLCISFLALVLLLHPALTAQEEKKEKDTEKKEEKTTPEKKKEPAEEKLIYSSKVGPVKLVRVEGSEYAIDVPLPDPIKIQQVELWKVQQLYNINQQRNPQQATIQMAQYHMQLQQKLNNGETTTIKTFEVKAGEGMKVRLNFPPVQYDDQGNLKKYTNKQLAALRGKSKWPGYYPGEVEMLKVGQMVEVYFAKSAAPITKPGPRKKGDVEEPVVGQKPEVVLFVVLMEPWKAN
jgi:hypothetical protein